jgi:flavin-dependent dehydrogenase
MRPVEIVGGGLAGLGLGLGLRAHDVPVTILESGDYPRHRVCGEFITGLDRQTSERLQINPILEKSLPAHSITWFETDGRATRHNLPEAALCLSRYLLDDSMAQLFTLKGGKLVRRSRAETLAKPGRVLCCGRRPDASSPWIGLKQHFHDLVIHDDLEVHFGKNAYVGLTRVENQRINVCGLFPRGQRSHRHLNILLDHIEASGLRDLSDRLAKATALEDSACAVAGLDYGTNRNPPPSLGDSRELIPPFTGHGMTIALQSAALATETIRRWSAGEIEWSEAVINLEHRIGLHLHRRLSVARLSHQWLLDPTKRKIVFILSRSGLLPFTLLYRLLH